MYANKRDKFDLNVMNARVKVEAIDFNHNVNNPANIRLDEDVLKTSWRRLSSSFSEDVFKTSWSRRICLPQPYVFRRRLQDVFKTSWSRPIYSCWLYVLKTSSRRLRDVLVKTNIFVFAIRLQDVLQKGLQDVFKKFWRRLQNVFKTSSRRLQDVSWS